MGLFLIAEIISGDAFRHAGNGVSGHHYRKRVTTFDRPTEQPICPRQPRRFIEL